MASAKQIRVLALAGVAGLACSAMAQSQDNVGGSTSSRGKVRVQNGQLHQTQREVFIDPIGVRINGRWVPFTLGNGHGSDSNAVTYDNITGTTGNFVVPIPPANTVNPQFALDDSTLGGSTGPRRLTGVRVAFATNATVVNPTTGVGVDITWFQNLAPANSPVETGNKLDVFVAFAAPTGGWAVNTTYTSTQFSFFADGPILTSSGAFEAAMFNQTGAALNTDFTPAWSAHPGGIAAGGSSGTIAWIDQNANGDYESGEAVNIANSAAGDPVNLRIAFQTEEINASPTGSCCLANGSCVKVAQAECTTLVGVYGGNGTACGNCGTLPVLWNNGPLSTGALSISGSSAPTLTTNPNATWSEFVSEAGCTTNTFGLSANITGVTPFRLADDFIVPAAQLWNVQSVTVYSYVTGGSTITPSLSNIVLRILRDDPATGATVWGDTTTNVLTSPATQGVFTNIYRIASSQASAANVLTNRGIWSYNIPVGGAGGLTLAPGHYYVDYGNNTGFVPHVTLMTVAASGNGVRQIEGANARQFLGAAFNLWTYMGTGGAAAVAGTTGCLASTVEMPFVVAGARPCYANCDQSTAPPILNANDFQCFLNAFAGSVQAGLPLDYANCDGSTANPILNANDFQCFLNAFAVGCPT